MNELTDHYWQIFYGRTSHFICDEIAYASGYEALTLHWIALEGEDSDAAHRMLDALRWS